MSETNTQISLGRLSQDVTTSPQAQQSGIPYPSSIRMDSLLNMESSEQVKLISGKAETTSSITLPPSPRLTDAYGLIRTPTSRTPRLASPPLTNKHGDAPSASMGSVIALYSSDQISIASPEQLRSMIDNLSNAHRDMRLSAAHYKLQYNMAVMESQESASRMAVELAMAQREIDVLQQNEAKWKSQTASPEKGYPGSANAVTMSELKCQNRFLQEEKERLQDLLNQQKHLLEHKEGELVNLTEENDRLKTRIRNNRDHVAPFLEHIEQSSPRPVFGLSHQTTPRNGVNQAPPPVSRENSGGPNKFEALLLADKMLSQETTRAPATPIKACAPKSRSNHRRGAQSMSSLPPVFSRCAARHGAETPRTPPTCVPYGIPQSASSARNQPRRLSGRRQSSNSTITASSTDEEEAFTDREEKEEDEVPESRASQAAADLLRGAAPATMNYSSGSTSMIQSKIFGRVKKGPAHSRPCDLGKRWLQPSDNHDHPQKRGRVDPGTGLGIGGLLQE